MDKLYIPDPEDNDDDEEFTLFQKELDIQVEAEWLARKEQQAEAPFADRALDNIDDDDDEDLDDTVGIAPIVGGYMLIRKGGF
ncbi:hypothetical protein AC477_00090 [miscellaneous Crenarchaeota group-1 archaeon SG8-32-1]|uniref:Uncharacterized protein n=1 Tax=miscellaneous Crenarchaeota group-1 archaeon SG8-32-1 TaxID=1685124 RepID=A0A0M0C1S8_9ARCH|nr:MAG: hypothetical protein AC477_00090 [miscellaneous Crenarchaeota group-1 archaeon SG8-32-1]